MKYRYSHLKDNYEQFTSYEAQIDYYTKFIQRNPEWEFVKVYTDEGISGTNTKHRDGFNEMIGDGSMVFKFKNGKEITK